MIERIVAAIALVVLGACGGCPPPPSAEAAQVERREPSPEPAPPPGSVLVRPVTVEPGSGSFILFLADESGSRVLPVVIGETEAQIIDMRMRGEHFERPLTHDLLDTIVRELGAEVVYVHVDKLRDNVFVGSVYLWDGREMHRIDSRTSDAVAVALGHDAPIYVAPIVLEAAGERIGPGRPEPESL